MTFEYLSSSESETIDLGRQLAQKAGYGRIFCLKSQLGGGKTILAKGICIELGVESKDIVTSPTFTLVNQYRSKKGPVYHVDMYRIPDCREAVNMGMEEILDSGACVVIEWAERVEEIVGKECVEITIEVKGENERLFNVSGNGF